MENHSSAETLMVHGELFPLTLSGKTPTLIGSPGVCTAQAVARAEAGHDALAHEHRACTHTHAHAHTHKRGKL